MPNAGDMGGAPQLIANLDAVAMLREMRGGDEPDPVQAAAIAEAAGVAGVAVELREDRRFIQDRDVRILKETVKSSFSLAVTVSEAMLAIAEAVKPDWVLLVPDRDAGETVPGHELSESALRQAIDRLKRVGIRVGLRLGADLEMVKQAAGLGAHGISLDVTAYTGATDDLNAEAELEGLRNAADYAHKLGLRVRSAGGLSVRNCEPVFDLRSIGEHEMGHGLMARALLIGLDAAVRELLGLMRAARPLVPQYRA
jgi:pyridoxine 5-phosphate synthase